MIRRLIVLLLAGTLCHRASSAEERRLRARFLGNAAMEISDGDFTLLTDFPYKSGAFGYMTYDPAELAPRRNSVCLFTHAHADHFEADLVGRIGCTVVGPPALESQVPEAARVPLSSKMELPPLTITPIPTRHGAVEHDSYLVEWNRLRLFFTGDTDSAEELGRQTALDVLFITPWLFSRARAERALPSGARVVIYHHRRGERVEGCDFCLVPRQGETFDLPDRRAPRKPR